MDDEEFSARDAERRRLGKLAQDDRAEVRMRDDYTKPGTQIAERRREGRVERAWTWF